MNILAKLIIISLISLLSYQAEVQDSASITVSIEGATSNKGKMFVAIYNAEGDFLKASFKSVKSSIVNKSCTVTFEGIPEGVYAVSVFHDENDNGKLDSNFLGIPTEDYACSNDARG